jgi:cyclohexanone monooxygenase
VNDVAQGTMYTADTCFSWYNGSNVEGKPRVFLPYVGGMLNYMARCNDSAANGYEGFVLSR